ncbi:hypothetical protein ACJMK2_026863 [Sinanodonta woodiana]|uniref:Ig-like domain-containing protein n=1 Tax=Sinanodonta woodiana TaxID=1069815 RepID=A0ABD3XL37_SINWO
MIEGCNLIKEVHGVTLSLNPQSMVMTSSTANPTTILNMQCSSSGTIDVMILLYLKLSRRKFTESTFNSIASMTLEGGPDFDPTVPADIQNRSPNITGSVDSGKKSGTMTLSINAQGLSCGDQAEFECSMNYLDTNNKGPTVTDNRNFTVIIAPSEVVIDSPEYYDVNGNTMQLTNNSVHDTGTRIKFRCTANVGSVLEGEILWERSPEMGTLNLFIPYTPAKVSDIVQETSRQDGCFYRRTSTMYYNMTELDKDGISFRCRARTYLSGQLYEALANQQYRVFGGKCGIVHLLRIFFYLALRTITELYQFSQHVLMLRV